MSVTVVDTLRDELKSWENAFKLDNGGRKPSRADIKANPAIADKYKQFSLLRAPVKQPIETPKKSSRTRHNYDRPLKEIAPNAAATTPHKTEPKKVDALRPPVLSPMKEEQPTPAFIRSALGPTPQRDGHVLGLFDMLPNGTPSKHSPTSPTEGNGDAVHATPSKSSTRLDDSAFSKTPQSSSKRYFLDSFITTPGKRKREEDEEAGTPSSKKLFATPSFLRRISMPMAPIGEEDNDGAAMPPPRRMKPLNRSFSAIIKELKDQEEERMGDEWDIMNELEAEVEGGQQANKKKDEVQVSDSQLVVMPLGPDRGPEESESEEEVQLGANGLPRKVYKKKGAKRSTRKSNLKPKLNKPKKAADLEVNTEDHEDDEEVAETQTEGPAGPSAGAVQKEGEEKSAVPSKNPIKRAAKKVSENYQRLKIKSHQPNSRGGKRFGRR